jgi:hypothetical protein
MLIIARANEEVRGLSVQTANLRFILLRMNKFIRGAVSAAFSRDI